MRWWHLIWLFLVSLGSADPPPHPAQGLVFRVEGGQAPLYLGGTIHLMQPEDYPLPAAYETAFQACQQVIFEVPPAEMDPAKVTPVLQKYAFLNEGTLEERLSAPIYASLGQWAAEQHVPLSSFAHHRPWLVAMAITQQAYEAVGMKSDHGIDVYFSKRLTSEPKLSGGLETMDEQFRLLSSFSAEVQEQMILQSIAEAKLAHQELELLLAGWRAGQPEVIAKTMAESFATLPEVGKLLLHDRNLRWLPKLKTMLGAKTPTLVLVGAGHLCGEGSLVALLKTAGFTVTQLRP